MTLKELRAKLLTRSLAVALVMVLVPCLSLAQQDQGVITGRVTDASGAVLPGVTIAATRVATGIGSQTATTAEGLYTIPALPVGSYRVVAELTGFKRTAREAIDVHAQTRVRVDFQLELRRSKRTSRCSPPRRCSRPRPRRSATC